MTFSLSRYTYDIIAVSLQAEQLWLLSLTGDGTILTTPTRIDA